MMTFYSAESLDKIFQQHIKMLAVTDNEDAASALGALLTVIHLSADTINCEQLCNKRLLPEREAKLLGVEKEYENILERKTAQELGLFLIKEGFVKKEIGESFPPGEKTITYRILAAKPRE